MNTEGDCTYCGALDGEPCNYDCLSSVETGREEKA